MVLMPYKKLLSQHGIISPLILVAFIVFALIGYSLFTNPDIRNKLDGISPVSAGPSTNCDSSTKRPCYDKKTAGRTQLLGKNAENTFNACVSNSAPNNVGDFYQKTAICDQEKVTYCHDGKSANYLRKFTGDCKTTPPPSPPPTPLPSPTPTASPSASPFKIVSPNGGEAWPFGSEQVIKWTGGDTINNWPIYLSLIDAERNMAIREFVINTANDEGEAWIVDLPLGTYYRIYGQGCRDGGCTSTTQWDQSDSTFNVVAGSIPIGKITSSYPTNQSLVSLVPGGGETWVVNSSQSIKWSGGSDEWNINIALIDNSNNTTYTTVFNSTANDGVETWVVPSYIPPGSYTTYISCTNCPPAPAGYTGGYYTYGFRPFNISLP